MRSLATSLVILGLLVSQVGVLVSILVILGLLVSQVGILVSSLALTDDEKPGNKPSHSGPPSLTGGSTSLKPSHSGPPSLSGGVLVSSLVLTDDEFTHAFWVASCEPSPETLEALSGSLAIAANPLLRASGKSSCSY
jgi:hypothetical protein